MKPKKVDLRNRALEIERDFREFERQQARASAIGICVIVVVIVGFSLALHFAAVWWAK